ncbi:DUF6114 domain-containing protein [Actinacidiphila yeochonensis]|uniref:DUF6114 domain-containing protein n=1 Tax=Actinacidiphila yeochonensis TaxID=89050 RepID=UPI0005668BCF|nr:DUF6114 domain-containing protein [Actinacidiphila yeochonensis]
MSAESIGLQARLRYGRLLFRRWRWTRPFWAGLLTLLSGLPIAYFPYANLTFGQLTVRMSTTTGSASLIIGVLLFVLGLTMWFQSAVRVFAGVASIMLALVSLPVSNFGGFLAGFVLGLLGGAMAVSWAPGRPADEPGEKAELPEGEPGPRDEDGEPPVSGDLFLPAQGGGGLERVGEPVSAGRSAEEETTKENGRHRAG